MSIYDAGRGFTAAHLHVAAAAGNWSPYYLAYAWLTGVVDPRAAYERDNGTARYQAWADALTKQLKQGVPSGLDLNSVVLERLTDDILASDTARNMLRDYATLHGQRGAPG